MTIDEAIKQFEYDAECNRADLDFSYAEDNEQVAEWLKELKKYKENEFDVLKEDGQLLYKQGILDGYDKAIDDFAEKVKEIYAFTILEEEKLNEIAEQLKAGGENEY